MPRKSGPHYFVPNAAAAGISGIRVATGTVRIHPKDDLILRLSRNCYYI